MHELSRGSFRMGRRIFIGDIQGCLQELEQILDEVGFDPARDRLHPVGDLVNRGPDSLGCLRLLRELDARAVLGNHDLRLLRVWRGLARRRPRSTVNDVLDAPDREELLEWLAAQPLIRSYPDVYQIHAGLHPHWTDPERELGGIDPCAPDPRAIFATRVRHCDAEGGRPDEDEPPPAHPFIPWFRFYRPEEHEKRTVVFGHWSDLDGVHEPYLRGLDTGCVWGGTLTAWIPEQDRLVSVPAARAYRERPRPSVA